MSDKRQKLWSLEERGNSWRVTKQVGDTRFRVSFDHRPTDSEIVLALAEKIKIDPDNLTDIKDTFGERAKAYIDAKKRCSKPISPSTEREYVRLLKNAIPDELKRTPLKKLHTKDVQRYVDDYSRDHSPKSTKNFYGFICSVLKDNGIHFEIKTPELENVEKHLPSPDEVKKILQAVENTKYSIPYRLACCGLRRGELIAITSDDVEILNDLAILHITKSRVKGADRKWTDKKPKTQDSRRNIVIPVSLATDIINQGYAFKGDPSYLNEHLQEIQDKLGIKRFPLHQLRHYFASELHLKGVADVDIRKMGGWSRKSNVLETIYEQSRIHEDQERQRTIIDNLFSDIS